MKHLIFLTILADNYLKNPLAPAHTFVSELAKFTDYFTYLFMVPFAIITSLFVIISILHGRRVYAKTGNRAKLNKAAISALYVISGSSFILIAILLMEKIFPWLLWHGYGNFSMIAVTVVICGSFWFLSSCFIKKEKKKIYSKV